MPFCIGNSKYEQLKVNILLKLGIFYSLNKFYVEEKIQRNIIIILTNKKQRF